MSSKKKKTPKPPTSKLPKPKPAGTAPAINFPPARDIAVSGPARYPQLEVVEAPPTQTETTPTSSRTRT